MNLALIGRVGDEVTILEDLMIKGMEFFFKGN